MDTAVLALAAGLLISRRLAQPDDRSAHEKPVPPAYETCFGAASRSVTPPFDGEPPSLDRWEVVPGANGTIWSIDRKVPSRRYCYPHGSTLVDNGVRYPGFVSARRWRRMRERVRLRAGDVLVAT